MYRSLCLTALGSGRVRSRTLVRAFAGVPAAAASAAHAATDAVSPAADGIEGDFGGIGAGSHHIGRTLFQFRRAELHRGEVLGAVPGEEFRAVCVQNGDGTGSGVRAESDQHRGLGRAVPESACHTDCAGSGKGTAGDFSFPIAVQGRVSTAGRSGYIGYAAGDPQIAVGIQTIAVRIHSQGASGDGDAGSFGYGKGVTAPSAKSAGVRSACGIESVITGFDRNGSAGDVDAQAFDPLIAVRNGEITVGYGNGVVGMDAVIAGGDGISSAGNGYISIGMKGIIGSVQGEGAAGDYQLCRGFQTLGAGLV